MSALYPPEIPCDAEPRRPENGPFYSEGRLTGRRKGDLHFHPLPDVSRRFPLYQAPDHHSPLAAVAICVAALAFAATCGLALSLIALSLGAP